MVGGLIVGGFAYASIPDSAGVIHACFQTAAPHTLVLIDNSTESCTSTQTPITWNQTGPAGPSQTRFLTYDTNPFFLSPTTPKPVLVFKLLPKGNWDLIAKAQLLGGHGDADASCGLVVNGTTNDNETVAASPTTVAGAATTDVSLLGYDAGGGNTVQLVCSGTGSLIYVKLAAIKVGSLNVNGVNLP